MANVDNPNGFRAVKSLSGSYIPQFTYKTKENLALNPGDAVVLLTDGTLDIATASSAAILGVCQSKVAATASTRKDVLVVPASRDLVFSGQCSGTMAETDIGEAVDIEGTTGIMEINEDASSVGVAQIVGLEQGIGNAVGANARVLFVWRKSQWDGQA